MRQGIIVGVTGFLTVLALCLLAGEDNPAHKPAADWLYPDAKDVSRGGSSGPGGAVAFVVQETADDIPKILQHYRDKLGVKLETGATQSGGATDRRIQIQFAQVTLKSEATGGSSTVCTFKTKTAVSTLVVCRSPEDKLSTVTITHVPLDVSK
jgi:hypothetical protein